MYHKFSKSESSNQCSWSASMNVSLILLGLALANSVTRVCILLGAVSSLQRSRLIFMRERELSLDSLIVERRAVLINLSWLKLRSLSQDVIGSVRAILNKACRFGYVIVLHCLIESISLSGRLLEELASELLRAFLHFLTQSLYSIENIDGFGKSMS